MNVLIADSGSTKTEWVLINDNGEKKHFRTNGLHPYFSTYEQLIATINEELIVNLGDKRIDIIYFYGAGCGSEARKAIVRKAVTACFEGAKISIESDLLAAAKACFGDKKGIACILGTGSNSCVYDGRNISKRIPSLGFTLGDEGSGGYFGKQILNAYYYKTMPEDLRQVLKTQHDMDLETVLNKVYREPQGNRFVASFSKILGEYPEHEFVQNMVQQGFEEFADKQLAYFEEAPEMEIGFVGSIASVYAKTLQKVLSERSLTLGIIVRKPVEQLVEYHQRLEV